MQKLLWKTERRKINDLIPFEGNPRQMTEKQVEDLKKSIQRFDLVEIPAIDTDNTILAGHQRIKIMQLLGRGDEEIDVRVPNRKLTDQEVEEYVIRSNKNTGEWNFDLLANFDKELLIDIGFSEIELKLINPNPPSASKDEQGELDKSKIITCPDCGYSGAYKDFIE